MTEAEKLAALDRAATQGVWQYHLSHVYGPDPERELIAQFRGTSGGHLTADRDLVIALVNAYRTGKIVLIGPDAVDALRANKQGWENAIEMGLLPPQHHDTARALIEQCRAALAALETDNG